MINLNIHNLDINISDVKVKGLYNDDFDLIPILMVIVYSFNDEELMVMASVALVA